LLQIVRQTEIYVWIATVLTDACADTVEGVLELLLLKL